MLTAFAFLGGMAFEAVLAYLIGKYNLKQLAEKDIAYLEAKAAALKKAIS